MTTRAEASISFWKTMPVLRTAPAMVPAVTEPPLQTMSPLLMR